MLFAASLLVVLSVSFLCSLLESSVLSLRPGDVATMRERDPELGQSWERLRSNIGQPIAAILILNTVANVVGASLAGAEFGRLFGQRWLWLFSALFALLIIQWGEILPKTLGVRYRRFVAAHAERPLRIAIQVFRPLMWLTRQLNRPFEGRRVVGDGGSTVEEIRSLASYASLSRLIDQRQESMISKSMMLHDLNIARIMVPRTQVVALEQSASVADLLAVVGRHGYSRVPVYREQVDDIIGVVLAKDLLIALNDGTLSADELSSRRIDEFVAQPTFVPETASVADMMAKASEARAHMVLVLDEHGGFMGLVTLEDALEELFGEIVDEHDRAEQVLIQRVAPRRWVAAGSCPIDELASAVGVEITAKQQRYTTLSGLLMWITGRVPREGEVIQAEPLSFRILDASPTVPRKVEVTKAG